MIEDTLALQEWSLAHQLEVGSGLKVSPATPDHLDSREREDLQVYPDPRDNRDSPPSVVVVSLDLQATQEREVRKETPGPQGCLCQVPQDAPELLVLRVLLGSPDRRATPPQDRIALPESLDVPAYRERAVTPERRARKVRRATPV